MNCPRCGSPLSPVQYDGETIQVCSQCKGEWLAAGELKRILDHHDEVFTPQEIAAIDGVNKEIFTAEATDHDELDCPECAGIRMEHFNYGETSGIILHRCNQCNGIWTDKDQLEKVEALVDGWKGCFSKDMEQYGGILKKVELQEEQELGRDASVSRFGFINSILRHLTV
jgi:Zn-finger nucleic acid-binding protein